ncbi:hypothetical protein H2201_005035 [Coniosporium apollinis]|uniref:Uncharacterized protein n=1 Tax=Coniosporium apollinis TaxID=61459 RepID=A0ABQ9NQW4_9PEZI|nr:hypothetical protein H2201_005035 [Coniosporium apollinis]
MRVVVFSTFVLSLATTALASDGITDLQTMTAFLTDAALQIWSTQITNGTAAYNGPVTPTMDLIANISAQVNASKASLEADQNAFTNGQTGAVETTYLSYIDTIPTFAQAIESQGRTWHDEMNAPVFANLQSLGAAIQAYGSSLRRVQLISQTSMIRTIRAVSAVSNAQRSWGRPFNYPGKRSVIRNGLRGGAQRV